MNKCTSKLILKMISSKIFFFRFVSLFYRRNRTLTYKYNRLISFLLTETDGFKMFAQCRLPLSIEQFTVKCCIDIILWRKGNVVKSRNQWCELWILYTWTWLDCLCVLRICNCFSIHSENVISFLRLKLQLFLQIFSTILKNGGLCCAYHRFLDRFKSIYSIPFESFE